MNPVSLIYVDRKKNAGVFACALIASETPFCYWHADVTGQHVFGFENLAHAAKAFALIQRVIPAEGWST